LGYEEKRGWSGCHFCRCCHIFLLSIGHGVVEKRNFRFQRGRMPLDSDFLLLRPSIEIMQCLLLCHTQNHLRLNFPWDWGGGGLREGGCREIGVLSFPVLLSYVQTRFLDKESARVEYVERKFCFSTGISTLPYSLSQVIGAAFAHAWFRSAHLTRNHQILTSPKTLQRA
jgi:hypothetical protein